MGDKGNNKMGLIYMGGLNRKKWAGVQCKGKDNYTNKPLTEDEVRDKVGKERGSNIQNSFWQVRAGKWRYTI